MNTRSTTNKDEAEKAYQKALQSDHKALRRPREQPVTSTPFVPHASAPKPSFVTSPPSVFIPAPDPTTPDVRQILSDSPLSASAFGLTAPPPSTNIPPSPIEGEITEEYPNLPEDSFNVEPTHYISLNKSEYSFRLAITESAIEEVNDKTNDKNTTEILEAQGAIESKTNNEPVITNSNMNNTTASSTFPSTNSFATLSYAVEAVPFFDGQNISVEHFIEGCELARAMLPPETEPYFTKVIHNRLTGEARRSIQDQDFTRINQLTRYLKNIFGSTKNLYQLQAELGRIYQKANESVLSYANRVKALGRGIFGAHRNANNGTVDQTHKLNIEKEMCYSFIRGLTPEIERRITRNLDVTATVNEALRIERELQEINEIRGAQNFLPVESFCQICRKAGHTAEKCRLYLQNTVNSNLSNEILICQICKKRGHSADKCRLRDPTVRNPVKIVQSNIVSCQICSKPGHTAQNCLFNNQPNIVCQNCHRLGHSFRECRSNSYSNNNNIICQICNKTGHNAKNCYSNKNRNFESSNEICQWCNRHGHPASQCRERQNVNSNQNNNVQVTCQLCNKIGHKARECRGNQRARNNLNQTVQNPPNPPDQCRYCKATGHLIENCVLRLENNRKKQGNYPGSPTTSANRGTNTLERSVMTAQTKEISMELL